MQQPEGMRPAGPIGGLFCAALLLGAVALSLLLIGVQFDLRSQLVFSAGLLLLALLVNRAPGARVTYVLILATLLVTTRYMYWRATSTLVFEDPFSAAAGYTLFGAELYAYVVTLLGFLQMARPLKRPPAPLPDDPQSWPTVDVFIPTYNEPLHVVSATVAGALNLEWPRERLAIHLLDDGDRPEFRRLAAEAGINYRARQDNRGAKAGNLNAAIAVTGGDLIAIFDCDHVPARSFLQVTAGWFLKDDNLAQLQTPHHFYNPDPVERNLDVHGVIPNEGSLFYGLIQDGNDLWNATFFCGSCALIRRTALEEVGGIAVETVTEDAHTSLKLHRKGWNSAYINLIQAAGLATETLAAHVNQRIRWARGLSQMLRLDNPLIASGLNLAQRLCYLNAMLHFLYAVPRLVFLLAPLCFLFFDLYVIQAEAMMVAAMALPHLLHTNLTTARMHGRWRRAFWAEVYETILSFYILMPTLIALIAPSRGKFNVTEKGATTDRDYFSGDVAKPFVVIALLNFCGLVVGVYRILGAEGVDTSTTWLNIAWTTYNLIIVGVALSVACETRQTRGHFRRDLRLRAWLGTPGGHRMAAYTHDLSESGVAVLPDEHAGFGATSHAASKPSLDAVDRLMIEGGGGMASFPVALVAQDGPLLRLNFAELSFDERRALVGLLYSPADSWIDADRVGKHLGALRSLLGIIGFGTRGWLRVAGMVFRTRKPRRPSLPAEGSKAITGVLLVMALAGLSLGEPAFGADEEPAVYDIQMLSDRVDVPISLGDGGIDFRVPFAVRRDSVIEAIELQLSISYHDRARNDERRLQIRVNDEVVWRAGNARALEESVNVTVPGVLLDEYNTLIFELARDGLTNASLCSGLNDTPFELKLHKRSRLLLDAAQIPLANELSSLPLPFFDPRDPRTARLSVVMPSEPNPAELRAAAQIAGWLGRLADYRGALFDVRYDELPLDNAIVIATGSRLPANLTAANRTEPSIRLLDNPRDPARQLLLVHAPTPAGLDRAVRDLSERLLSDDSRLAPHPASRREASGGRAYGAPRWLPSGVNVPLHTLSTSMTPQDRLDGSDLEPITLPFALPGDFYESQTSVHRLRVEYRFSPIRTDMNERLYILLNGRTLRTVELDSASGAPLLDSASKLIESWLDDDTAAPVGTQEPAGVHSGTIELTLPANSLLPDNRLEFRFAASRQSANNCDEALDAQDLKAIEAQILPGSWIHLQDSGHLAALPDLALFANSGMPFTRRADLSDTSVILPPTAAPHDVGLMMTTLGRLAALGGALPYGAEFTDDVTKATRINRVVIAADNMERAIDALLADTPLALNGRSLSLDFTDPRLLYRAYAAFTTPARLRDRLVRLTGEASPVIDADRALIAEMRTPGTRSGTTLLLHARDARGSAHLAEALVDRRRISELQGGAALIDGNSIVSLRTGSQYFTSDRGVATTLAWWLGGNLPIALLLGLLAMVLFGFGLPPLLERVARRRLDG